VPGYQREVHHVEDWATTRCCDVNTLTLACGSDHPLVESAGWTTRKRKDGTTEWDSRRRTPRKREDGQDYGQPRTNIFHHPDKLLADQDDDDP
jgi:hypothetical protein